MKKPFLLIVLLFLSSMSIMAQSAEQAVAASVEAWKQAMINADKAALENLVSERLTYGHSSGKLDTKAILIDAVISGKSKFITMDIADQKIIIIDKKTAMVRHTLSAKTKDNGVDGSLKLHLLQVWAKEGKTWRMIGRQACKLAQ